MIVSLIQGGLGNQLFQYATAYALAKESGQDLVLDTSFFHIHNRICKIQHQPKHMYRNCSLEFMELDNIVIYKNTLNYLINQIKERLINLEYIKLKNKRLRYIKETSNLCRSYQPDLFKEIEKGIYLNGFWQHSSYFKDVIEDIRSQIKPSYIQEKSVLDLLVEIKQHNSVGVHIRRGDFVKLGWDKNIDYYRKGISFINKQLKDAIFYFFSDDPEWVRKEFGNEESCICIELNTEHKDLDEFFALSACHHQIISESTFGWWAAYLNMNPNKRVVVPKDAVGKVFCDGWDVI